MKSVVKVKVCLLPKNMSPTAFQILENTNGQLSITFCQLLEKCRENLQKSSEKVWKYQLNRNNSPFKSFISVILDL